MGFYKCANGTLTLETCENGLLFDNGEGAVHNHCNYHWGVQCYDRVYELLPNTKRDSNPYCEYSFGLFKASSGCDEFYYRCAYGEAEKVPCIEGLAYDERIHACNWPDLLLDINCNPEEVVGFRCPDLASIPVKSLTRLFLPYPRFAVPSSRAGQCSSKFVTCIDYYPRLMNCGYGAIFDEATLSCVDAEDYPQCAGTY